MKIQELAARIKWKSVMGLIAVIVLLLVIIWAASNLSFPSGFKGEGDIQVRTSVEPARVGLSGKGVVKMDIRNVGEDTVNVSVLLEPLQANSNSMSFSESGNQRIAKSILIGPRENRELDFDVVFNAPTKGKYGVKIEVSPGDIEDEVFFEVAEK